MLQLVYHSKAMPVSGSLAGLREILKQAQTNNERDGLTGFLLFNSDRFIQVLEGDEVRARSTYHRIQSDPRHQDVQLISSRTVRGRTFPAWSMGGGRMTPENEEIFIRHGVAGKLDPSRLTTASIVGLAMDLQDHDRLARARLAWGAPVREPSPSLVDG